MPVKTDIHGVIYNYAGKADLGKVLLESKKKIRGNCTFFGDNLASLLAKNATDYIFFVF